ncbi:DUF3717 domain-containing protein [Verticiella sediminum]|uniref:DUF3717 domain-containing protein n=1 Tax=Verticiella sediminum TaxID=1247510 RepID=A0A556AKC2_9BURK|nr:DUF3717 domain-containing protein [Verticiella sediminum]TSH93339.1 DUF3717 domain-containing protein [Verticiella sediminum]
MTIPITELERAINYWRSRRPSQGEERRLCPEAAALAEPYAALILHRRTEIAYEALTAAARAAFEAWRAEGDSPP